MLERLVEATYTEGSGPRARVAVGDVAAGRLRLVRDTRPEAPDDLGRAVPRPGGAPRGARGRRAAVRAGLHRPHLRQPGGQGRTGRGALRAAARPPPPRAPGRHLPLLPGHRPRGAEGGPQAAHRVPAGAGGARPHHRRVEPAGAGESALLGRRPLHAVRAPRAAHRQPERASSSPTCTSTASTTSSARCSVRRTCATSTTSRCSPTTRRGSRRGGPAWPRSWRVGRLSLHPEKTHVASMSAPATFLGFELRPSAVVGCRRRTCGASATACGVSATAGGRAPSRERKWSSGFAPGCRHVADGPGGTPPKRSCTVTRPARHRRLDLAHEIDLLGTALRLTPEQRAAARPALGSDNGGSVNLGAAHAGFPRGDGRCTCRWATCTTPRS